MQMIIGGKKVDSSDGKFLEAINPATNEVLGTYPCATKKDAEQALDYAQAGKLVWRKMSFNERARILSKAADLFEQHADELAELQCKEMGKHIFMCKGELTEVPALLRSSVAAGMHMLGEVYPNNDAGGVLGDLAVSVSEPLGVVLCIAPFNFPISTLTFKVAPALATGNAVIIKAPSDAALSILRYTEILVTAGIPDGVVQVLSGPGQTVVDWLIDTDKINAVSFTGSTEVGIGLVTKSAKYLHKTFMELGGNDPCVIFEDANLDYAVGEAMTRILNAGQICCGTKRFLVHNTIKAQFVKKLTDAVSRVTVGNPLDPKVNMGPCVSESAAKKVAAQVGKTIEQGAKLAFGGKREGAFYTPTILDAVTKDMDIAKDMEIFGPVFPIIGFDSEAEAVAIANQTCYGLNAGVITGDLARGISVAAKLQAGTVVANGASLWRRDTAPFGGYKMSGMGREGIQDLIKEFTQRKTLVIKGV
jgi:succinate-semialdehyde dehydrogenase/glutarate-semialdehyde dehydrogenase